MRVLADFLFIAKKMLPVFVVFAVLFFYISTMPMSSQTPNAGQIQFILGHGDIRSTQVDFNGSDSNSFPVSGSAITVLPEFFPEDGLDELLFSDSAFTKQSSIHRNGKNSDSSYERGYFITFPSQNYQSSKMRPEQNGNLLPLTTIQAKSSADFWIKTAPSENGYYAISAYKSDLLSPKMLLAAENDSDPKNGVYHFQFPVYSDAELWFSTYQPVPQLSLEETACYEAILSPGLDICRTSYEYTLVISD